MIVFKYSGRGSNNEKTLDDYCIKLKERKEKFGFFVVGPTTEVIVVGDNNICDIKMDRSDWSTVFYEYIRDALKNDLNDIPGKYIIDLIGSFGLNVLTKEELLIPVSNTEEDIIYKLEDRR